MDGAYMPKAESTDWGTPLSVFRPLHSEFSFTVDVAAKDFNTKVPERWYSPEVDGLRQSWFNEVAWCNPPYGSKNIAQWLAKATEERARGATTVLLLPNTTDCKWFHDYVWDIGKSRPRAGIELRFVAGRIKFVVPPGSASEGNGNVKGSILVIVRPLRTVISACPTCGHSNHE